MKLSIRLILITLLLMVYNLPANADRANRRQMRQNMRVKQGIKSGQLTRKETKRLRQSKRRIQRAEDRMKSDGHLGKRERRKLEKMQDARSKQIKRLKHNDRSRD